jgi:hypothetical protein
VNLKTKIGETFGDFMFQRLEKLLHFTCELMTDALLEQNPSISFSEAIESLTHDFNVELVIGKDKPRCVSSLEKKNFQQDGNEDHRSELAYRVQ